MEERWALLVSLQEETLPLDTGQHLCISSKGAPLPPVSTSSLFTVQYVESSSSEKQSITYPRPPAGTPIHFRFSDITKKQNSLKIKISTKSSFGSKRTQFSQQIDLSSFYQLGSHQEFSTILSVGRKKNSEKAAGQLHVKMQYQIYWLVDFISKLPTEIAVKILGYLDAQSLHDATRVCKSWQVVAESEALWHSLYKQRFQGVTIVPGFAELWRHRYTSARGPYETINAAMFEISPSETMIIPTGEYEESINITQPMQIIGDNSNGPVRITSSRRNVLFFRAQKGVVRNLHLCQRGSSSGRHFAVSITGGGHVLMEGCDISSDSLACVAITNRATPTLRNNKIHSGAHVGVLIYNGGRGTFLENEICGHGSSCVEVRSHACPTFLQNNIHGGKSCGIFVVGADGIFEGNQISDNHTAGIKVRSGANPIFRGNTIHRNKHRGVVVYDEGMGYFRNNHISANHHSGVKVRTGGDPTFIKNHICDGFSAGVLVHNGGRGLFQHNQIYNNALSGIEIRRNGDPRIQYCQIYQSLGGGVYIHSEGLGTLEFNKIHHNVRTGVKVKSARPILRHNHIYQGQSAGIGVNSGYGVFESNQIYENQRSNVQISCGGGSVFRKNEIHSGLHCGVLFSDGGVAMFSHNNIYNHTLPNVEIIRGANPKLESNHIHHGHADGVVFHASSGDLRANDIHHNRLANVKISAQSNPVLLNNRIYAGHAAGVVFEESQGVLQENDIRDNALAGVIIRTGSHPLLMNNTIPDVVNDES